MPTVYFDAFAGASGDMILGALIDCGVSLEILKSHLKKIPLSGYTISSGEVIKGTLRGTKIHIKTSEETHPHRRLADILHLLDESTLSADIKHKSSQVFHLLAEAEGRVHGVGADKIHFHEVGAVDSIIDICATIISLDLLQINEVYCSPLPLSRGYMNHSHGVLPLPAPATMELIANCRIPCYSLDVEGETVTPTGAALLGSLSKSFRNIPNVIPTKTGYGAGTANRSIPNLLRVFLGEPFSSLANDNEYILLQTNIDDMNPEIYEHIVNLLFSAGASDVYLTPIQMKKGRPAVELSVLTDSQKEDKLASLILTETTSLGLRVSKGKKIKLDRQWQKVETPWGSIRIKIGIKNNKILNISPEYEDCRKLAELNKVPLKEIYNTALALYKQSK